MPSGFTTTHLAMLIFALVVTLYVTTRLNGRGKPESAGKRIWRQVLTLAVITLTAIYFYMRYGPK